MADAIEAQAKANLILTASENPDTTAAWLEKSKEQNIPFQWVKSLDNRFQFEDWDVSGFSEGFKKILAENPIRVPLYRNQLEELDGFTRFVDSMKLDTRERMEAQRKQLAAQEDTRARRRELVDRGLIPSENGHVFYDGKGNAVVDPVFPEEVVGPEEAKMLTLALEKFKGGLGVNDAEAALAGASDEGKRLLLAQTNQYMKRENALIRQMNSDYPGWVGWNDRQLRTALDNVSTRYGVPSEDMETSRFRKAGTESTSAFDMLNLLGWMDITDAVSKISAHGFSGYGKHIASIDENSPLEDQRELLRHLGKESVELRGRTTSAQTLDVLFNAVPYMAEFAATGGMASVAKGGARVGLYQAMKSALREGGFTGFKAGIKALGTTEGLSAVGKAAGMLAVGEAKRLPAYGPKIGGQSYNDFDEGPVTYLNGEGISQAVPEPKVEELFTLIARNTISNYLENVSEGAGTFVPSLHVLEMLPAKYKNAMVRRFIGHIAADGTKKDLFLKALQDNVPLNGALGEAIEEYVANGFARGSTILGEVASIDALDMGRESWLGGSEENQVIWGATSLMSIGGNLLRLPFAIKHNMNVARFVDEHRGMVERLRELPLMAHPEQARDFLDFTEDDYDVRLDPEFADTFYQASPEFSKSVGITPERIAEAKEKGTTVPISHHALVVEQAKTPENGQLGESILMQSIHEGGIVANDALSMDLGEEAVAAWQEHTERIRRYGETFQAAVAASADGAGVSKSAVQNFGRMFGMMAASLERRSVKEGVIEEMLGKLAFKFAENPESFEDSALNQEGEVLYQAVADPELENTLESGEKVRVYRAAQLIDGKLYPPMAAKVAGDLTRPIEIGKWEQADERPDLVKDGKFKLDKANGASITAAYNPYFHTSRSPLNDQFSSAYKRPNLVTLEVEVPASELTSGYRADGAKDAVGEMEWHSGPVSSKLTGDKRRRVILSRWNKPVRIVPESEVADRIVELLDGTELSIPEKVVSPSLRAELEKRGVAIDGMKGASLKQAKLPKSIDVDGKQRPTTNSEGKPIADTEEKVRNFWRWFGGSETIDEQGRPVVYYHGTNADFNVFDVSKSKPSSGGLMFFNPVPGMGYGKRELKVYLKGKMTKGLLDRKLKDGRHQFDDGTYADETVRQDWSGSVVVGSANQIKSATDNTGAFDPNNPDIRYQDAGLVRGQISFAEDFAQSYNAVVTLFRGTANASTLAHESAHWVFRIMQTMVDSDIADDSLREDYQMILKWMGRQKYQAEVGTREYEVEREEAFARAFEAYIIKGTAPVSYLEKAFEMMKRMLTTIYKDVLNLNVELDDDIIGVFNRLLSTEELVERESPLRQAAAVLREEFSELLGMSAGESKVFSDIAEKAIAQQTMSLDKEKIKRIKALKPQWINAAEAARNALPVYQALAAIKAEGKLDYDAVRDILGEELTDELREKGLVTAAGRKLKDGTQKPGKPGKHPADFAVGFGFESAEALLESLYDARAPQEFVDDMVKQEEAKFNNEFQMTEAALSTGATVALLDKLIDVLAVKGGREGNTIRKAELKAKVREDIRKMTVDKIKNDRHLIDDCRRNAKELTKQIKSQDYLKAMEAASALRYTLELLRNLAEAKKVIAATEKMMKKSARRKKGTILVIHDSALKELAYYYGFTTREPKFKFVDLDGNPISARDHFRNGAYDEYAVFGEKPQFWSDFLFYSGPQKAYTNLDFSEISEMFNFASFLNGDGRERLEAIKGSRAAAIQQHIDDAIEMFGGQKKRYNERPDRPRIPKAIRNFFSWGRKLDNFMAAADNYEKNGPNRALRSILLMAAAQQSSIEADTKTPAKAAIDVLAKAGKTMNLTGLPAFSEVCMEHAYNKWTPEMVYAVCLNLGNEGNRKRLMDGFGWSQYDLAVIAERLSTEEWNAIQQIWDAINGRLRTEVANTFFLENHYQMELVEATPFQVRASDGNRVDVRGGYYPIHYIYREGFEKNSPEMAPHQRYADVSSTKDRSKAVQGPALVKLSLGVVLNHIHDSSRYAATRMPLRHVMGVAMSKKYRSAFGSTQSYEAYDQMISIIKNMANPTRFEQEITDGFESWARTTLTATALLGNVRTVMMQGASVTVGLDELGHFYAEAVTEVAANPVRAWADVRAASAMMADRAGFMDIDLREGVSSLSDSKVESFRKGFQRVGYYAMRQMDMLVATVAWKAAYNKAMASYEAGEVTEHELGMSNLMAVKQGAHNYAVAQADDFVARTQGAIRDVDLAPIQLSRLGRLISPFLTATNAQYNTMLNTFGQIRTGRLSPGAAVAALSANVLAPAVFSAVIGYIVAGGFFSDDDDAIDKANKTFIKEMLSTPFGGVPLIRDLADAGANQIAAQITGAKKQRFNQVFDAGALSSVEGMFRSVVDGGSAAMEGNFKRALYKWSDAVGNATHTPAVRVYDRAARSLNANFGDLAPELNIITKEKKHGAK